MIHLLIYFFISLFFAMLFFRVLMADNNNFFKIYDYPDDRKVHNHKILKIGGVGVIFCSLFVLLLFRLVNGEKLFAINQVESLFVLSTLFMLSGALLDDIIGLSAIKKLFFQLTAVLAIINTGFLFEIFNNQFGNYIITVVLFVLIINCMNLIDGVDGLSVSLLLVFTFLHY